jgi:hypothetical protein
MKYKPGEIYKIKYNGRKVPVYFLKVDDIILPRTKASQIFFPGKTYNKIFETEDVSKYLQRSLLIMIKQVHIHTEFICYDVLNFDEVKNYKLKRHLLSF